MKKLYTLSFALLATATFAQVSQRFPGSGPLNVNGWITHSGATPGQLSIAAGSLTYSGINSTGNKVALVSGNTEDVNIASVATLTGTVYYSAILNLPNITGLGLNTTTGDYFLTTSATAGNGVTPNPQVTSFQGRIYIKKGASETTFNIGILNNSGGTAAPTFASNELALNTPIFVVVKYDLGTNTASLFLNPTIGGAEGTATVTNATGTTAAPAGIAAMAIRQGASTGNIELDELRLDTTWAAVTSATLSVKSNEITGLKVYPNPVLNGTLFIDTNANADKAVAIFDVLGKQVLNTTTSSNSVNVSNLKGGVYIVKITEEGKTATRKLVIR